MMGFNFGHGIFAFYVVFILFLGFRVYNTTKYDHDLVSDQYYQDDLEFQRIFDARALGTKVPVSIEIAETGRLVINVPEGHHMDDAVLFLQRPDSKLKDLEFSLGAIHKSIMLTEGDPLLKGRWNATLTYVAEGKPHEHLFALTH